MTQQRTEILFPVGRIVQGNLYKARDKDAEGKPLLIKSGPNQGQARVDFYFAVAIAKNAGEQSWAQTEWGAKIYQAGLAAFPQQAQSPTFAWKVEDGDSTIPNRQGRKNADREGYRGHWIVKFSGGYAPNLFQREADGRIVAMTQPDAVKPGYYVQVKGNVAGNGSMQQPGLFINHQMVLFAGYGTEIVSGPDANEVFGAATTALPAGASAVPLGMTSMPVAMPGAPLPGAAVPGMPAAAAVPGMAVAPNPGFLAGPAAMPVPGAVPMPGVPAAPAVAPPAPPAARQMTAKANGTPYESFIGAGWNDAALVQQGYMLA